MAASRLLWRYPTVAMRAVPWGEWVEVGVFTYDPRLLRMDPTADALFQAWRASGH